MFGSSHLWAGTVPDPPLTGVLGQSFADFGPLVTMASPVIGMSLHFFHLDVENLPREFRISLPVSETVVITGQRAEMDIRDHHSIAYRYRISEFRVQNFSL